MEGDIDIEKVKELAQEVVKQTSAHNCRRLLNDFRKANVKLSTIEIYDLPTYFSEAGLDRLCKRALIVSRDFDDYKFFENVSSNLGHLLEVFVDSDEPTVFQSVKKAHEWLGLDNPNQ
jgi:hypothetical protein